MKFENVDVGVNNANGNLRIHPVSATLFEGSYEGDVRIDASGNTPVLSVNERISGVKLAALANAMFDEERVTGTINGSFALSGRGDDFGAIQRSLSGNMSFELDDGAFEGIDIWYELRRAYALVKQQAAPERVLPARTEFSNVSASGPVTDGVFRNDNLRAELPFMQVTGKGTVDLAAATLDYGMTVRVLNRPELAGEAGADELRDLTRTAIPLRITGPLSSPSVKPDIEGMLKERVKEEVKDRILGGLLGGRDEAPADEEPQEEEQEAEQEEEKDLEDKLKDLKSIFD